MYLALDTETFLITPGNIAPQLVCMTVHCDEMKAPQIFDHKEAIPMARSLLQSPDIHIVLQNGAFDFGVLASEAPDLLPLIFKALQDGRIHDTLLREKLLNLEDGQLKFGAKGIQKYSLSALVGKYLHEDISASKGADAWRTRYSELFEVPTHLWPKAALEYALDDAVYTLRVFQAQEERANGLVTNEIEQVRAAFSLHLMTMRGLTTDIKKVEELEASLLPKVEAMKANLKEAGILRPSGSKNIKQLRARISEAYKGNPPLTASEKVSYSRVTLIDSGDPLLIELGDTTNAEKLLSTYIPMLKQGIVNPSYSCVMESGRTSSFRPNIQNVPRMGGVRECYIPRAGYALVSCDYDTLELCSLAQVCIDLFGYSKMGDAINSGRDLHLEVAAEILQVEYGEEARPARGLAKVANFGFPGGMGVNALITFAKGMGVIIEEDNAKVLKAAWMRAWPEMQQYFAHVSTLASMSESFAVKQLRSGRIRGGCYYSAACNTYFQGLAADGAKDAIFHLAKACYTNPQSALYGSYPIAFIHDEVLMEIPFEKLTAASEELVEILVSSMKKFIPDVKISCEPVAMERWYKGASEVRNEKGDLILWQPSR